MFELYETGQIKTDEEGIAGAILKNVKGEIWQVQVTYGECNELTNIKLTLSNGEEILYFENNQDFIHRPRKSLAGKFTTIVAGEETGKERLVNFGDITIEIDNAGADGVIFNVSVLVRQ